MFQLLHSGYYKKPSLPSRLSPKLFLPLLSKMKGEKKNSRQQYLSVWGSSNALKFWISFAREHKVRRSGKHRKKISERLISHNNHPLNIQLLCINDRHCIKLQSTFSTRWLLSTKVLKDAFSQNINYPFKSNYYLSISKAHFPFPCSTMINTNKNIEKEKIKTSNAVQTLLNMISPELRAHRFHSFHPFHTSHEHF